MPGRSTPEQFWSRVDKSADCWLWNGAKDKLGYGGLAFQGRRILAHRLAYELTIGQIPPGLELDHLCRNPSCVNPEHLEAVAHQVNTQRGNNRLNGANHKRKTHCPQGHPYNLFNTYVDKRGHRSCRECGRANCRRYYHSLRASS